jgi:hypothetical protein
MFGAPANNGSSLFGAPKPTEPAQTAAPANAFGAPPAKPAEPEKPKSSFDAAPAAPASGGFFGAPKPAEKPVEAPKNDFASMFGPPKADAKPIEPPKPISFSENPFGPPKPTEPAQTAAPANAFGAPAPKPAEPEKPKNEFASLFGPPKGDSKPIEPPKPITFSANPFGAPKPAEPAQAAAPVNPFGAPKPTEPAQTAANPFGAPKIAEPAQTAAPVNAFASMSAPATTSVAPATSNSVPSVRMRSPPLPADSNKWSENQLTDYYNLFAIRSLNHFFKEELSKQDLFADLTPLCNAYNAEAKKIRALMDSNQRYKFDTVPSKRAGGDNDLGGGKRRAFGEGN